MIPLTRLNGDHIAINPDRIERADVTPDVVLTMTDGSKYVIAESLDELVDRIRYFRASIIALSQHMAVGDGTDEPGRLRLLRDATRGEAADRALVARLPVAEIETVADDRPPDAGHTGDTAR